MLVNQNFDVNVDCDLPARVGSPTDWFYTGDLMTYWKRVFNLSGIHFHQNEFNSMMQIYEKSYLQAYEQEAKLI